MNKNKISLFIVSFMFIGIVGCSDRNSDEELINTDHVHTDSDTYNSNSSNTDTRSSATDTTINSESTTSNNGDKINSAVDNNTDPYFPDSHSKISGGNTGNTWSGH